MSENHHSNYHTSYGELPFGLRLVDKIRLHGHHVKASFRWPAPPLKCYYYCFYYCYYYRYYHYYYYYYYYCYYYYYYYYY